MGEVTREGDASMQRPDAPAAFACRLDDGDLVKACAPEQPAEVKVGQRWMNCSRSYYKRWRASA